MKQNQRDYFQNNQNLTENLFSKLGFSTHSSMYSKGEKMWKVIQVYDLKHRPTEGDRLWCLTMAARDLQNAARWKFVTANLWAHQASRENNRKQYNHFNHLLKRPQRSIFCIILHHSKRTPRPSRQFGNLTQRLRHVAPMFSITSYFYLFLLFRSFYWRIEGHFAAL